MSTKNVSPLSQLLFIFLVAIIVDVVHVVILAVLLHFVAPTRFALSTEKSR